MLQEDAEEACFVCWLDAPGAQEKLDDWAGLVVLVEVDALVEADARAEDAARDRE